MCSGDARLRLVVGLSVLLAVTPAAWAAVDTLKKHVEFLASDELEGRMTGSEGERRAAEYLAGELEKMGAVPLPGAKGFVREFEFSAGTTDTGSSWTVRLPDIEKPEIWKGIDQVRALSFSGDGSVTGQLVFAGYGLQAPEGKSFGYDSYAGIEVEDKIVIVLRYWPEDVDDATRTELSTYSGLRHKAMIAREHGAKALLVVTGPNSPNAGQTVESKFDAALSGSGILAASVSGEVAARLFDSVEGGLAGAQSSLDTGNPHVTGFDIPDLTVTLEVKVEREKRTARNVIGLLAPGEAGAEPAEAPRPYTVLGAHYDHLGRGRHGNSMAKRDEQGRIHPGADDNASGVAAVIETGARLAGKPRRGPLILAFWSGEEYGLLGASDFLKDPPVPVEELGAYVNFDMVGRVRDNRLNLQGVGSSTVWSRLIEQTNVVVGFDVQTQSDPYLPTDASAFYLKGVPIVGFFTGGHEQHHRPADRPDTLNYADMDRVVQFASIFARKLDGLDERPDYVKVERRQEAGGSRDGMRAYTGTIPDYATEVEGLRLSGVIGGGPAEQAGLREGDVIVEFGGRTIANVYDYTYALGAVKIGKPVAVVCLRDGERVEFTITPTARP
jgi:hypothetical protein